MHVQVSSERLIIANIMALPASHTIMHHDFDIQKFQSQQLISLISKFHDFVL